MTDRQPAHYRRIRSFVRREGRLTPGQQRALDRWLPVYGVPFGRQRLDLPALFGRTAPVTLEIGFGNGDTLFELAQRHPERDFLGIEVHRPGAGRLLKNVAAAGLDNIRVSTHDAVEVLEHQIPPASLDSVLVYFPDPWPKKRHHKRRLVQPPFVRLLASRMREGGRLQLATDWQDYAFHMLDVLEGAPWLDNTARDPSGFVPRPEERPATHFEQRGLRKGHPVYDLLFVRNAVPTDEPPGRE